MKFGWAKWAAAAALVASVLAAGSVSHAADETTGAEVKPVLAEKLPNVVRRGSIRELCDRAG